VKLSLQTNQCMLENISNDDIRFRVTCLYDDFPTKKPFRNKYVAIFRTYTGRPTSHVQFLTIHSELCGRVVSTTASCSGGPGFKSRPRHRLF
jgi:hypothetical protein